MKKVLVIFSIMSLLFLTACTFNENEKNNDLSGDFGEQQEESGNNEILNKSFEERTAAFFEKREEASGDRLRKDFGNIRLSKVDSHYELKADLVGDVKIDSEVLENAMNEIKTKKLDKIEIKTTSDEPIVIYGRKPQQIIDWHESVKNDPFYEEQGLTFEEAGVPTYYDADWLSAESDADWLNAEGIPMYIERPLSMDDWLVVKKEDDGYYLEGRSYVGGWSGRISPAINEKDAISLTLLADDKIVLDINDFYGNLPDDYEAKELAVEEYYNLSPKDGTTYITEDNLEINISNMSDSNYFDEGLEIKDGAIYVIARCDGP